MSTYDFLSVSQAAAELNYTDGRVRQMLLAGILPGRKLNARAWAVDAAAVHEMSQRRRAEAHAARQKKSGKK